MFLFNLAELLIKKWSQVDKRGRDILNKLVLMVQEMNITLKSHKNNKCFGFLILINDLVYCINKSNKYQPIGRNSVTYGSIKNINPLVAWATSINEINWPFKDLIFNKCAPSITNVSKVKTRLLFNKICSVIQSKL